MNFLKNRKGFTLVELLAVIVILALIMSIAIISMSGIMQSARYSTMKETGLQIINGVRQQLTLANELNAGVNGSQFTTTNGIDYYFTSNLLEKGGKTSPLGGEFKYATGTPANSSPIGIAGVFRYDGSGDTKNLTCSNAADTNLSFVRVKYNSTTKNFEYAICLTAGKGNYYINVANGTETKLLDNNDNSMIVNS